MPGGYIKKFKEEKNMIAKEKKQAIIKEFGRTEGDTRSKEVKVSLMKARIHEQTDN